MNPYDADGRLGEVMGWCLSRPAVSDLAVAYRTSSLRPRWWREGPPWPAGLCDIADVGARQAMVADVAQRRRQLLERKAPLESALMAAAPGGSLVLYNPDMNLFDAAAAQATGGLFDVDNTPPWDTWVTYVRELSGARVTVGPNYGRWWSYLVAWIPPAVAWTVDIAVPVSPEQCLLRAADLSSQAVRTLLSNMP